MSRRDENTSFICIHCHCDVLPLVNGSYRNHCPACLWSLHVDERPGDRAAACGAPMRPVALRQPRGKGWAIVHACTRCGARQTNRLALDDLRQPDSIDAIAAVSQGG